MSSAAFIESVSLNWMLSLVLFVTLAFLTDLSCKINIVYIQKNFCKHNQEYTFYGKLNKTIF